MKKYFDEKDFPIESRSNGADLLSNKNDPNILMNLKIK